jgi:hypothetical protein
MKRSWFSGFITALLIVSLIGTVSATVGSRTATLDYNNIKVTLDGKAVSLVDANGNPVEPFAIAGTTYLPVRAISSALGLEVGWDQSTTTVTLKSGGTSTPSTTPSGPSVPLLNHEYGPMTLTSHYSTGEYWDENRISSLVFTSCEMTNIGKYRVKASIQGTTDSARARVDVRFYDAAGRMIGEESLFDDVVPNTPYNILVDTFFEKDVVENATKIEFYSHSGAKAGTSAGGSSSSSNNTSSGNKTPVVEEKPVATVNVPLLNHEYGPMKVTNHWNDGGYWSSNDISSLVFTKCELNNLGLYEIRLRAQGTTDDYRFQVNIRFYDANGTLLDEKPFLGDIPGKNEPYNTTAYHYLDADVIENATRIEFYSHTGEKAVMK